LAGRHFLSVVIVSHLNKSANQDALHRVSGSIGLTAAARAVWLVERDSDDEDSRLFLPIKNNIGKDRTGLRFFIEGENIPRLEWSPDPVTISADDILSRRSDNQDGSAIERARVWLADLLSTGAMDPETIKQVGAGEGFSWATIRRAHKSIGIIPKKMGFAGGRWVWALPEDAQNSTKTLKIHEGAQQSTCAPSENLSTFDGQAEFF